MLKNQEEGLDEYFLALTRGRDRVKKLVLDVNRDLSTRDIGPKNTLDKRFLIVEAVHHFLTHFDQSRDVVEFTQGCCRHKLATLARDSPKDVIRASLSATRVGFKAIAQAIVAPFNCKSEYHLEYLGLPLRMSSTIGHGGQMHSMKLDFTCEKEENDEWCLSCYDGIDWDH